MSETPATERILADLAMTETPARDEVRAAVERVAKVLDLIVRQMHALDLGDDETQSKLDGWAAGIGGSASLLRGALTPTITADPERAALAEGSDA